MRRFSVGLIDTTVRTDGTRGSRRFRRFPFRMQPMRADGRCSPLPHCASLRECGAWKQALQALPRRDRKPSRRGLRPNLPSRCRHPGTHPLRSGSAQTKRSASCGRCNGSGSTSMTATISAMTVLPIRAIGCAERMTRWRNARATALPTIRSDRKSVV